MTNIPLRAVQINWAYEGSRLDAPPLVVIQYNDEGRTRVRPYASDDDPDYFSSWGACNAEYANATGDTHRMFLLLEKFRELVVAEGLDPKVVNEALCIIPEWRVNLIWNGIGHTIPSELRDEEAENRVIANGFMGQPVAETEDA